MKQLVVQEAGSKEVVGLKDGPHHILCCVNCKRKLVDVWVVRPKETDIWNMHAKCCYCGDRSMYTKVIGGFTYQGVEPTNVIDVEMENDKIIFITAKGN